MSTTQDQLDIEKIRVEIEQIRAAIDKSMAETAKLRRETSWYPIVIAGSIIGGTSAIVVAAIKLLGVGP